MPAFAALVTPAYAAVLALFFIALSLRTVSLRRRMKVSIGPGEDPLMLRAIRAHSNCAEYAPITLVMIFFVELRAGTSWLVHALCVTLILGRIVHALGLSQVDEKSGVRVAGMALTFTALSLAIFRVFSTYL